MLLGAACSTLNNGTYVPRIVVSNRTQNVVLVDVRGKSGDGWLNLGTVQPKSDMNVDEVTDQGGVWTFRFRTPGGAPQEITLSREELRSAGWNVSVPSDLSASVH
jgi:hypothetical protein